MSTISVGGPMFEPANSGVWHAQECSRCRYQKSGGHYNLFVTEDADGMAGLRQMFPDARANEMNFVLFSTSGIHGMYTTIEEAEACFQRGWKDEEGEDWQPHIAFLIVHPRIVCLRYGNCEPKTPEDFDFLKRLRESSWRATQEIGRHE